MAFEPGHGRTAVPVRSALAGSVIAVAALAAAAVFGASLVGLVGTPHDYGQNWVQEVDFNFGSASPAPGRPDGAGDTGARRVRGRRLRPAHHRRHDRARDRPRPGARQRLPHAAGRPRADRARRDRARRADAPRDRRPPRADRPGHRQPGHHRRPWHRSTGCAIVGVAVLPAFSRGSFTPTGLGTGAVLPASVLSAGRGRHHRLRRGCPAELCYNFFLLRYRPGTDLAAGPP